MNIADVAIMVVVVAGLVYALYKCILSRSSGGCSCSQGSCSCCKKSKDTDK